ncbi:MAG: EAL domain-containing protein [Pseudomonadota bacterium]
MTSQAVKDAARAMSWHSVFSEPEVTEEQAANVRAKQFALAAFLTPIVLMASLVNSAVIVMSYWGEASNHFLVFWSFSHCFICGLFFLMSVREKATVMEGVTEAISDAHLERFSRGAMALGILWGVVPVIVVPYTDPMGQMTLGTIMSGMLFASAFILARLPRAALAFMTPAFAGVLISLQIETDPRFDFLSILTLTYFLSLAFCVKITHSQFVRQHLDQVAVAEQSQLISLLLRDFEETTSDWLWQTDAEGVLLELPVALPSTKNPDELMTRGRRLMSIFKPRASRDELETFFNERQSFRDLELELDTRDGPKWWLLAGKPIIEKGVFVGFRGVASDITASKQNEDRIAFLAHFDPLTGLMNRASLNAELEKEVRRPPAPDTERALILLDLDNFKWVNDTLGHQAGDELLRLVTKRLERACSETDFIARLGGDEFALIVERSKEGEETLEAFAEKVTDALAEPYLLWGSTARSSASVGVRRFDAFAMDARTLLKHADLAMYQAKRDGRSTWCEFSQDLDDRSRERRDAEEDLRRALDQDDLRIFFQPQIDARSGLAVGAEALLRWQHPSKGLIYPGAFIELAEDCGLISRIGDWVLRSALESAQRLPEDFRISVNISPLQIHNSNLVATVINALEDTGVNPERLELEITESVLMIDTDYTLDRLTRLKELGVRIALDDFGTGFSSLAYLRRFPFDKIKIDQSFISELETSEDSRAITIATLGLAHSLRLRCTAEGVETAYQADFLDTHNCDELQGFFFSRAQPIDTLLQFVERNRATPQPVNAARRLSLVRSDAAGAEAATNAPRIRADRG